MQDGLPVVYASRSLIQTEVNHAQIEKELSAIVFRMEKFETYLYGRDVLVETDHKSLEPLFKKSPHSAPKRLQPMQLRLQKYDFTVTYKKRSLVVMADVLSRAFLPASESVQNEEQPADVFTSDTRSTSKIDIEQIDVVQNMPIIPRKTQNLKRWIK